MPRRYPGDTLVLLPCASGNSLVLRHLRKACFRKSLRSRHFGPGHCYFTSFFPGISCALLADGILLSGQRTRLAQARTAPSLRSRSDAGIPLILGERVAVSFGSGAQTVPPAPLPQRAGGGGLDPTAPKLFVAAQHNPDPISAPATLENPIQTRSGGCAERTDAAPRPTRHVAPPRRFSPLGFFWRGRFHNS